MHIKLLVPDIENCLNALEDLEDPTDSEKRTIEKLRTIRHLQKMKASAQKRTEATTHGR